MKVKELIAELMELDGDMEVVLSSDAEGNSFHCLDELSIENGDDLDVYVETPKVVCLWPEH